MPPSLTLEHTPGSDQVARMGGSGTCMCGGIGGGLVWLLIMNQNRKASRTAISFSRQLWIKTDLNWAQLTGWLLLIGFGVCVAEGQQLVQPLAQLIRF